MKKAMLAAALLVAMLPSMARAVSAPSGLTAGAYVNATMPLYWNEDASVAQWYIYVGGKLLFSPTRSQSSLTGSIRSYVMQPLAPAATYTITMRSLATGQPLSAESTPLVASGASTVPVQYVVNAPGTTLATSGGGGGGGASAVTVLASALPAGAATEATLSSVLTSPINVQPFATTTGFGVFGTVGDGNFDRPLSMKFTADSGIYGLATLLYDSGGNLVNLGQQTSAASLPVVIASNQPDIPVSSSTLATQSTLSTLNSKISTFGDSSGAPSLYGSGYSWLLSQSVLNAVVGTGGATVPIQGVALGFTPLSSVPSGPNGLLTASTLYLRTGSLAAAAVNMGQQVMTSSLPVVLASNQSAISVGITNTASGAVQVAGSVTNTVAANQTQVNGVAVSTSNGTVDTGTQRVAIASNNTPFQVGISHTVAVSGSLSAGITSFGGSVQVGNGTAASSLRVAIASDNTPFAISATGNVANDSPDSGNPVKVGGVFKSAMPANVTDGDRVNALYDGTGRQIVVNNGGRGYKMRGQATMSTTIETTLVSGASQFLDLETLVASNGSTQTVRVDIRDAVGGSVVFSFWLAPGAIFGVPIGSILFQTASSNSWTAQLSQGLATNDVRVMAISTDGK